MTDYERARFVGGSQDGLGVTADREVPELPETVVADGGDRPAGYRLVRGLPGEEWQYVLDDAVAHAYMVEMWGESGAGAYERVLQATGDAKSAWAAAKEAKAKEANDG